MKTETSLNKPQPAAHKRRVVSPAVDIHESREAFLLVADLPGVVKEDLNIHLDRGELSFEGLRRPRPHGSLVSGENGEFVFRRVFTLPGGIDADRIQAELSAGVLRLTLPKAQALKPRTIAVQSA